MKPKKKKKNQQHEKQKQKAKITPLFSVLTSQHTQ